MGDKEQSRGEPRTQQRRRRRGKRERERREERAKERPEAKRGMIYVLLRATDVAVDRCSACPVVRRRRPSVSQPESSRAAALYALSAVDSPRLGAKTERWRDVLVECFKAFFLFCFTLICENP